MIVELTYFEAELETECKVNFTIIFILGAMNNICNIIMYVYNDIISNVVTTSLPFQTHSRLEIVQ